MADASMRPPPELAYDLRHVPREHSALSRQIEKVRRRGIRVLQLRNRHHKSPRLLNDAKSLVLARFEKAIQPLKICSAGSR